MGIWPAKYGKRVLNAFLIAITIVACVAVLRGFGAPETIDRLLWETRFKLDHRPVTGKIIQVDIDAKSLNELGVWPLPRRVFAKLTDILSKSGAQDIVYDVDFSSASNPVDDQLLAKAFEKAGNVSLATFRQAASSDGSEGEVFNQPLEQFLDVAWPVVVMVPMERDSRIWRNLYGYEIAGVSEVSAAALLGEYSGETIGSFQLDYSIAIDEMARVSLVDVISGTANPELFRDKKVIIGASALELRDLFPVPVFEILPGSVIQALGAETLLQDRALVLKGEFVALVLALTVFLLLMFTRIEGWAIKAGILALTAVAIELVAFLVQKSAPVLVPTASAHILLTLAALCIVLRELGFLKLLSHLATVKHHNSQQMLGHVFEDSFDAIVVLDRDGKITAASNIARELFGNEALVGKTARSVLPTVLAEEALTVLGSPTSANPVPKTLPVSQAHGKRQLIEFVVTKSQSRVARTKGRKGDEKQSVACITCRDVTEQREYADRLEFLAQYDPITGLLNRSGLEDSLSSPEFLRKFGGQTYCLLQFSISNFDQIVASLGFSYGDRLRQAVAARLKNHMPENVSWAAITANVFAGVFVAEPENESELEFVETIQNVIGEDFTIEGARISVQLKFGYVLSDSETSADDLLKMSGNALAKASREVRTPVVAFREEMSDSLQRRRKLETELFKAISRDELRLDYQPLVNLKDNSLFGVEALLRWDNRQLGPISPAEFVPIAEENGYIVELGAWALNRGMKEALSWSSPLRVSINLSAIQFCRGNLVTTVTEALERTRFPADRLDLEVTESLFIDESLDLRFFMEELKALGCSFSLDDFGTGYSSLSYIAQYPFSKIKLDRAFVRETFSNKKDVAVIESVVHLAKGHEMALLVEGIETHHQAETLRGLGCQYGQGYLFGRPMSATNIETLLAKAA
ncbi:Bacteriophytochrome cph2 [Roseibium album]|nr:Bacteriophytochrome cph2 [Roseibium album]